MQEAEDGLGEKNGLLHLMLDARVDSGEQVVHALLEWRVPGGPILILLVNVHARPVHIVVWNHRPLKVRHPAGA